jgi:hypothetical protein
MKKVSLKIDMTTAELKKKLLHLFPILLKPYKHFKPNQSRTMIEIRPQTPKSWSPYQGTVFIKIVST